MERGHDIAVSFPGLHLVHHNLPGSEHAAHQHREHQLLIPLSGEIRVACGVDGRTELACGPGRMLYLPPATEHAFTSSARQGERLIAMIPPQTWNAAGGGALAATAAPAHQLVKELLFYLLLNASTKHAPALIATLVHTVSETLESTGANSGDEGQVEHWEDSWTSRLKDPRLQKAAALLLADLASPPPMADVARKSGLGVRTMNRLFLTETGLTPKQAQAHARIAKARALLVEEGASVTAAAFAVGYSSLSQFISVFRQLTGQLPSDLRRLGQKPQHFGRKPKAR